MTLSEAIWQYALSAAQAGDWSSVVNTLKNVSNTAIPRKCGSLESSIAVATAGADPKVLLQKLKEDATGELLFTRLADGSSEGGVVWAEPLLTVPYLQSRVSDFGQNVIDALKNLSAPVTYPWANITEEECSAAYLVGADVLLSVNITSGVTRCSLQIIRDGVQVKLQSFTEGQGTEADQSLLTAIETAINTFLVEG